MSEIGLFEHQVELFLLLAIGLAFITSLLMRKITRPGLYALIVLPGVILHEAAHNIVAFITFARPVDVNLIPIKNPDGGWTLGSVTCMNIRWYNAFPIAVAPLLLLLTPYVTYKLLVGTPKMSDPLWIGAAVILNMIVTHSAFPSRQDYIVASSKPAGAFIWLAGISYLVITNSYYLGQAIEILSQ